MKKILIKGRKWKIIKALSILCIILIQILLSFNYISGQNYRGATPINDEKHEIGKTFAFVIGISDYQYIPDLLYADRDALAFSEYLFSKMDSTSYNENIMLFLNQQATRTNILDAMTSFLDKPKKGDKVYFYFAGHGDIEDRTQSEIGLLLLYGAPEKNYFGLTDEVIQVNQIAEYFGKLKSKGIELIYIIDACHSGKLIGGENGKIQTSNAIQNTLSSEATLMLSCASNQLAIEGVEWGGGHGIFSYYLQEGLAGMADLDRDNSISLLELETYVKKNTYLESETRQTPVFVGNQNKILNNISDAQWDSINYHVNQKYTEYSLINYKGLESNYLDNSDTTSREIYFEFIKYLNSGALVTPLNENAIYTFRQFMNYNPNNYLCTIMRRKLITKLNCKFDTIVRPLLVNKRPKWPKALLLEARLEMDSSLVLINERHYLYAHLLARRLFLDAMICSYGVNINNYGPLDASNLINCVKNLHSARQLEPNAAYLYYGLGRLQQTMLLTDSSLFYLKKFVTLLPNSAWAHNLLGISLGDKNLFIESAQEFNKAIILEPDFLESYANLVFIYSKINQFDSAIYIAQSGLKLNPGFVGLRNNLADLYMQVGRMKDAKILIDSSLQIDSASIYTLLLKGQYYYKLSDFECAKKVFLNILKLKKYFKPATSLLASTFKSQGKYLEAIEVLKNYMTMDSIDVRFNYETAVCYYIINKSDSAELYFNKFIKFANNSVEYFELIADMNYFYFNQTELSEKYYSQALQTDSFNVEILSKLCINLIQLHKTKNLPFLQNLMESHPNKLIYEEYSKLAQLSFSHEFAKVEPLIDNLIQTNHEMKWRLLNDPIMKPLNSIPGLRHKIMM
ncbi:MAG: caspase family protein [Saprospiraceae bacterium]